jgi:hypothetical protein
MSNIAEVIEAVRAERLRMKQELGRLDDALRALRHVAIEEARTARARGLRPRRKMSAAARRKIAAAQRARWSKIKRRKAAAQQ